MSVCVSGYVITLHPTVIIPSCLQEAKLRIGEKLSQVHETLALNLDRYIEMPVEIQQTMTALRNAESTATDHMDDVEQRMNVAMETRLQYEALLQALRVWLESTEAEVEEQAADLPGRRLQLQVEHTRLVILCDSHRSHINHNVQIPKLCGIYM